MRLRDLLLALLICGSAVAVRVEADASAAPSRDANSRKSTLAQASYSDNFNRADENPIGDPWQAFGTYPRMRIVSQQLAQSNTTNLITNWAVWKDELAQDMNLEVRVAAKGSGHESVRLIARGQFSGDVYGGGIFAAIYPVDQTLWLQGVTNEIRNFPSFPVNVGDRVGLRLQGSTVEVTRNGAAVYTRTANYVGPGKVAIGALIEQGGGGQRLDDFAVTAAPAVATADLSIGQVGWPYAQVGSTAGYRLDVTNAGPSTANAARLAVTIPSGVTVLNASIEGGSGCWAINPIMCDLGDIGAGSRKSVIVVVRLDSVGNLGSTANVSSSTLDPLPLGNTLAVRTVGLETVRRLAADYRPALLFDTGTSERWRPLAIDRLLAESFGKKRHQICTYDRSLRKKCQNITSVAGFTTAFTFLDLYGSGDTASTSYTCKGPGLNDCDSGPTSVLYYEPTDDPGNGYHYVDYWWFLRWNDSPLVTGDHEGDWEGITVVLDPTGPPANTGAPVAAYALFAAHDGESWSAYLGNPAHVHTPVYVGEGTHSSNPVQCIVNGACGTLERSYDGGRPWGRNNDAECGELCVQPLPVAQTSWTFWPGIWGPNFAGFPPGGDSPTSPGVHGRYRCVKNYFAGDCPETPFSSSLETLLSPSVPQRASGFDVADCSAWEGPNAALVSCDAATLEKAIAEHALDERVVARVRIDGFKGRIVAAPGLTQALGPPLVPGNTITVLGPSLGGRALSVRIRQNGKQWIASIALPALKAGEKATGRLGATRIRPTLTLVAPNGRRITRGEVHLVR